MSELKNQMLDAIENTYPVDSASVDRAYNHAGSFDLAAAAISVSLTFGVSVERAAAIVKGDVARIRPIGATNG